MSAEFTPSSYRFVSSIMYASCAMVLMFNLPSSGLLWKFLAIVVGALTVMMLCAYGLEAPQAFIEKLESNAAGKFLYTFPGRACVDITIALFIMFNCGIWGILVAILLLGLLFQLRSLAEKDPDLFHEVFRFTETPSNDFLIPSISIS